MATATVDIEFRAKLDQLLEEVKKMGPAAGAGAQKAVDEMAVQWKRANRAAAKAASEQRKAALTVAKGFDTVKQAAEGMGGRVGGAVAMVDKFSRSVGGAAKLVGPWGAALAGTSLAIGGFAVAAGMGATRLYAFMDSAVDAAERLSGPMAAGTEDAAAALGILGGKMDTASAGADRLRVLVGAELAPSVGRLADIVSGAALSFEGFNNTLEAGEQIVGRMEAVYAPVMNVLSLGMVGALLDTTDAWEAEGAAASEAAAANKAAAEESAAAAKDEAERAKEIAEAKAKLEREAAAAREKAGREASKRRADALKEQERQAEEIAALMREQAEVAEEVAKQVEREEWEAAQATAKAWDDAYVAVSTGAEEIAASMDGLAGSMLLAWAENAAAVAGTIIDTIGGAVSDLAQIQIDKAQDAFDAEAALRQRRIDNIRANREEEIAGLLESGAMTEAQAKDALKQLDTNEKARKKALKASEKAAEAAALKSFRVQKAMQRSQAIIDGARAALSMIPMFSFIPPPGNVAAAAALATIATGAQLAVIGAQKAPDFPVGGLVADRAGGGGSSPDHVNIQAQPNEGILTGRGTSAVGGREGIDAINSGHGLGPTVIRLEVGARVIAEAIISAPGAMDRLVDEVSARLQLVVGQSPIYGRG